MITFIAIFLLFGAVYRLTRLVIVDDITKPVREHLLAKLPETHWVRDLVKCFWCVSMWLAFIAWGAWLLWPVIVLAIAVPLTVSTLIGLTARNLDY